MNNPKVKAKAKSSYKANARISTDTNPENDGKTHINVYSRGKTELGKFLNNLEKTPFEIPGVGTFSSLIGYWHWVSTGKQHDVFKTLYGVKTNSVAKDYPRVDIIGFEEEIKIGFMAKLDAYPEFKKQLANLSLPLCSYYVNNQEDGDYTVTPQPQLYWQLNFMEGYAKKSEKESA
jgi:hypothetical protein